MKGAVITVSDRGAAGLRQDAGGPMLEEFLRGIPAEVVFRRIVSDDPGDVREAFLAAAAAVGPGVILSTGGTGFSPRDTTPEAVMPLADALHPGVGEALRRDGLTRTPMAILSRGIAGRIGEAFFVTLPGSTRAVGESFDILGPLLRGMLSKQILM